MKRIQLLIAAILITIIIVVASSNSNKVFGSVSNGVPAVVQSTATSSIGIYTPVVVFASTSPCVSRVITTGADSVRLSFNSNFVPTSIAGHFQATSTTVSYDGGVFGCGPLQAISVSATSTITVSEFR